MLHQIPEEFKTERPCIGLRHPQLLAHREMFHKGPPPFCPPSPRNIRVSVIQKQYVSFRVDNRIYLKNIPCLLSIQIFQDLISFFLGSVLVYDFWTPPPPINFVHDQLFFSKFIIIYFFVIQGQVRLRYFLSRELRLGWAGGRALRPRVKLRHFLSQPQRLPQKVS